MEKRVHQTSGNPLVRNTDGTPLAFESDPPPIRMYAWSLVHLHPGTFLSLDLTQAAKDCGLSIPEAREAVRDLVKAGDLLPKERDRGSFRLIIRYPEIQ